MMKLVYKVIKGISTVRYGVVPHELELWTDDDVTEQTSQEFIQTIKNVGVDGFRVVKCDGVDRLVFSGNWSDIEIRQDKEGKTFSLFCRLIDDSGDLIGYMCRDSGGSKVRMSTDKVWEIAFDGRIDNVKAEIINGEKSLTGLNDFKLYKLPDLNV